MRDNDELIAMLRASAESYLHDYQRVAATNKNSRGGGTLDQSAWLGMADLGWLGLLIDEAQGGTGLGLREAGELTSVMGNSLFPVPYIELAVMPSLVLSGCGAKSDCEAFASGEKLFSLAWQDKPNNDSAFSSCTIIDGRLSGCKCFVAGPERDAEMIVSAHDEDGIGLFVVSGQSDGVEISWSPTASGTFSSVSFKNVEVDRVLARGNEAAATLDRTLQFTRVIISAYLCGLARRLVSDSVEYVNHREQFGRALSEFQTVSHRCVDMHIHVELAESVWRAAVEDPSTAVVCAAKARAAAVAQSVGYQAVQLHGAMGFTEACRVGEGLRLALLYGNYLGSPTAMRRRFQWALSPSVNQGSAQ